MRVSFLDIVLLKTAVNQMTGVSSVCQNFQQLRGLNEEVRNRFEAVDGQV